MKRFYSIHFETFPIQTYLKGNPFMVLNIYFQNDKILFISKRFLIKQL